MIDLDRRRPAQRTVDLRVLLADAFAAREYEIAREDRREDLLLIASFILTFVASELTVVASNSHEILALGNILKTYAQKYGDPVLVRRLRALLACGVWRSARQRYARGCASRQKGAAS